MRSIKSQNETEETRIKKVYAQRDESVRKKYSWAMRDVLYMNYRKADAWSKAFQFIQAETLKGVEVLDVGCGSGEWLRLLIDWGADSSCLHGIDILPDRIRKAADISIPGIDYRVGNGCLLPFASGSMNIVASSTVFSSILDQTVREDLAAEISRVSSTTGWVMVFDFAISKPTNSNTIGIRKKEIKRLFPNLSLKKVFPLIAPPPILRFLPDKLFFLGFCLENIFPFCCTHRLYLLRNN